MKFNQYFFNVIDNDEDFSKAEKDAAKEVITTENVGSEIDKIVKESGFNDFSDFDFEVIECHSDECFYNSYNSDGTFSLLKFRRMICDAPKDLLDVIKQYKEEEEI